MVTAFLIAAQAAVAFAGAQLATPQPLTVRDYPYAPRQNHEGGSLRLSMRIDTAGHPQGCIVTITSGSADLDQGTCELMLRKARFTPAHDADGKPVTALWTSGATWVPASPGADALVSIEPQDTHPDIVARVQSLPVPANTPIVEIAEMIGTDGARQACAVTKGSGLADLDARACQIAADTPLATATALHVDRAVSTRTIAFIVPKMASAK